jgi:hypothetical protein
MTSSDGGRALEKNRAVNLKLTVKLVALTYYRKSRWRIFFLVVVRFYD